LFSNQVAAPESIFMPFDHAIGREVRSSGNFDNWKSFDSNEFSALLGSESNWIQYWVELPTPEKQQAYRRLLTNYINDQKKVGRFERPLLFKLSTVPDMMEEFNVVPQQVKAMSTVSVLFLVVCSLNLVGLLLGKFLSRIPEISVRRALGASRLQVFWQHIVECEVVGAVGGVIGMILSVGVLKLIGKSLQNGDAIHLSFEMVIASIFLSLIAGLVAGLYPAWRVCTVPPAMQLKLQ
jgi:putative ABC transport system permease protein